MQLTVTEEGMLFCNSKRDIYFPYGCMDSLNMSFLGVIQAVSRGQVCCFTASREDKAELKELVKNGKQAMKAGLHAEPVIVDLEKIHVDQSLSPEEQLKQFKAQYIQGVLSREQYNLMKKILAA